MRDRRSLVWGGYERFHLEGGLECEADALGVNRAGEAEGGVVGEGDGLSWRAEAPDGQSVTGSEGSGFEVTTWRAEAPGSEDRGQLRSIKVN